MNYSLLKWTVQDDLPLCTEYGDVQLWQIENEIDIESLVTEYLVNTLTLLHKD